MEKHKDCIKGFYHLSKAWYGPVNLQSGKIHDRIGIGFYHPEGGTTGEFEISWSELAGQSVPQLKVFDDGWSALANMPELINLLESVDSQNITPDKMASKLIEIGLSDLTEQEYA